MSTFRTIICSRCGNKIRIYSNPVPTVDIIIRLKGGIVLIERTNPPHGLALPGGFVDYGESLENAAVREAMEETGLTIRLTGLLGVYSDPDRDPRQHTISTVFMADAEGSPTAGDDAASATVYSLEAVPDNLVFDHSEIIEDYRMFLDSSGLVRPIGKDTKTL
ncbi:MAG TPA: NUDIX hydrolase [Thermodesulfobacteriaceae bacterium]|nr:NUDIX hydrolase [Thermodesulfobacteriaceae bacterium]